MRRGNRVRWTPPDNLAFLLVLILVLIGSANSALQWDTYKDDLADYWAPVSYFSDPPSVPEDDIIGISTRTVPRQLGETNNADEYIDRIYLTSPERIFAFDTFGNRSWYKIIENEIVTSPTSVNTGNNNIWIDSEFMLYFGCKDGTVYAINDDSLATAIVSPHNVSTVKVNGEITTDIRIYNTERKLPGEDIKRDYLSYDRVVFGTSEGVVYCCDLGLDILWQKKIANTSITQISLSGHMGSPDVYAISEDGMIVHIMEHYGTYLYQNYTEFTGKKM